ncbi:MAG: Omp28-related outer membrane protein [Alistipes sp.]|nr:Omp28-related outer membrane protein [Alistipes sp.]
MKITKFFSLMLAAALVAVGCESTPSDKPDVPSTTGAITLEAPASIELGQPINFTVMQEGQDVTAAATIYETAGFTAVENPYTPTTTGTFSFYATKGKESSEIISVTVMASVPTLPEDEFPESTKFNHRVLLIDHTGLNCGNCPRVMDGLEALAKTDAHMHYNEACVHGGGYAPSSSDKAYSDAAKIVDQFYRPSGYPNIQFNFRAGAGDIGYVDNFVKNNTAIINSLVKAEGADAGIAVAANGDQTAVYVSIAVKAAVEQEYRLTAWLLENDIYNPGQSGATKDSHKLHQHALRNIAGAYSRNDISGDSIGVIAAGQVKEHSFELPIISNKWVVSNMEVLVIVSAPNKNGQFEVVNTAVCPINSTIGYEYL